MSSPERAAPTWKRLGRYRVDRQVYDGCCAVCSAYGPVWRAGVEFYVCADQWACRGRLYQRMRSPDAEVARLTAELAAERARGAELHRTAVNLLNALELCPPGALYHAHAALVRAKAAAGATDA